MSNEYEIDVDGTIDESLSKGLRKRFEREHGATLDEAMEAAGRAPNSAKGYLKWARRVSQNYFGGDMIIHEEWDGKLVVLTCIKAKLEKGLYMMHSLEIKWRNGRQLKLIKLSVALSAHAVERYFQRVGRPFNYNELSWLGWLSMILHQRGRFQDGHARLDLFDGQMIYREVVKEGHTWVIAVTFLSPKEMTDREITGWLMGVEELQQFMKKIA